MPATAAATAGCLCYSLGPADALQWDCLDSRPLAARTCGSPVAGLHGTGPAATGVHGWSHVVPACYISCLPILGLLQAAASLHGYQVVGMACPVAFVHLGLW